MRSPRVGVIEVEELIPHETLIAEPVIQTIMLPYGLEYGTCVVSAICPRFLELISLWRTADRPFLDRDSAELLGMLVPHLQNALKIRRTIRGSEQEARNAEAMLNASETACILLDEAGRIIYLNEAAQAFVSASDGILVQDDRIVPVERSKRKQFQELVNAARSAKVGSPGGAIALGRGPSKRPLQLHISPFRLKSAHRSSVRVLILATDPDQPIRFPDAILRQMYGLTPAETEIANGLLTGCSLEEIAALRKVSESTVRSQMKSVFGKTDTRRQGDLIRLLMTLPKMRTANTASF
jgi:DNA-binding CsgD family transcriptional regulator